jgi:DNA-binding NtrC family response regulator
MTGGLRRSLDGVDEVTIGRGDVRSAERVSAKARVALHVPDRKVSVLHARLTRVGHRWMVEDLGSTNGTSVNGQKVTDHVLADGDLVQVGQTVVRVRYALPTPQGAPALTYGDDPSIGTLGVATLLPALASELASLGRVATAKVPVLLLGDTGTGKEVVARAIHASSARPGSFIAVNCAALPNALVEAQLFGHTKGAFSGAARDEVGFVRAADKGTLFLDEIGDLPAAGQGALLRVLQDGEVVPVGAVRPVAVDMRVISATHQPIEDMVKRGTFRQDLFARLQGFTYRLWPLAQRREDIGLLVAHHLARLTEPAVTHSRISADAARALIAYAWPLNVRELVQALARALPLARDGAIEVEHLPRAVAEASASPAQRPEALEPLSAEDTALREDLVTRLRESRGNVARVARDMNKKPMQVYRWMRALGVDPKAFR